MVLIRRMHMEWFWFLIFVWKKNVELVIFRIMNKGNPNCMDKASYTFKFRICWVGDLNKLEMDNLLLTNESWLLFTEKKNSPLLSHLHLHFFLFQSVFQLKHECQVVKKHLHKRVWKKIFIYIKKPCISCVNDRILFFRQINHSLLLYKYAHTWRETTVVYSWLQEVNTWYPVGFQFCVFFYMSSSAMKKI